MRGQDAVPLRLMEIKDSRLDLLSNLPKGPAADHQALPNLIPQRIREPAGHPDPNHHLQQIKPRPVDGCTRKPPEIALQVEQACEGQAFEGQRVFEAE
jgi:hypothetical protein